MPKWSWADVKQPPRQMKEEQEKMDGERSIETSPSIGIPNRAVSDLPDLSDIQEEIVELRRAVLILCNVLVREFENKSNFDPIMNMLRPHIKERALDVLRRKRRKAYEDARQETKE